VRTGPGCAGALCGGAGPEPGGGCCGRVRATRPATRDHDHDAPGLNDDVIIDEHVDLNIVDVDVDVGAGEFDVNDVSWVGVVYGRASGFYAL